MELTEAQLGAAHDAAVDLARSGRMQEALDAFAKLVALSPPWADAWSNLGLAALKLGRIEEALEAYRHAWRLRGTPPLGCKLGLLLFDLGRLDEALGIFQHLVTNFPQEVDPRLQLGRVFLRQGKLDAAVHHLSEVVRRAPDLPHGHSNLGVALQKSKNMDGAIACFREALRLEPSAEANSNLASALAEARRHSECWEYFKRADELSPNTFTILLNYGNAMRVATRTTESIEMLKRALEIHPDSEDARNFLFLAYAQIKDFAKVIELCNEILARNPEDSDKHLFRSMTRLVLGEFGPGWEEYEWRWKSPDLKPRPFTETVWQGEALPDKTILVHAEQGYGDTLMFVRYLPQVKARVGTVIFEGPEALVRLLGTVPGIDKVVPHGHPLPHFDCHSPLLSLPRIFKTTLDSIPTNVPYMSVPAPEIEQRSVELGPRKGFRVGVVWQGNPLNSSDRHRSFPLKAFLPVANVPGVEVLSLQKVHGLDQIAPLVDRMHVTNLDARIKDFADAAAFMKNCDLLISPDTAITHLAGALGVRVWLVLPYESEWRWLLDREDSPWYPSMRIFRQSKTRDWPPVFERIATEVARELGVERPAPRAGAGSEEPVISSAPLINKGATRVKSCRHGPLVYFHTDLYVGRSLDRYGDYSEGEVYLFQQFLRSGRTVLEVGANIGAHTIPLAKAVGPAGIVLAFEPQRVVFQLLCANAALNGLTNIHTYHAAVGREPGHVFVPTLDPNVPQNQGSLSSHQWGQGDKVPRITIDSLGLTTCNFIKIDVEGMESDVIAGADQTIRRFRPAMYIENDRANQSAALIEQLLALGYRLYWHTPALYQADNYFGERENVFPGTVSVNMLALPAEMSQSITGLREVKSPTDHWKA